MGCDRGYRRLRVGCAGWGQWQRDPEDDVGEQAGAAEQEGEQPADADDRDVDVEIIRQAGANTADLFVGAAADEALLAASFVIGAEGMLGGRLLGAAVVAEVGAVGDAALTVDADHGGTSTELIQIRFYH